MKKILIVPVLALIILNLNIVNGLDNLTIQNTAQAQSGNRFELGIEYPEGNGSGCAALCGGPGNDCIAPGQYHVSCKREKM